jgi:NAD(P)-dependent dehydrogenase (short-subunit alcohol dehydrogenase family)
LRLAERGHDVAVHYAGSAEAAEATVAEIRAIGSAGRTVQADLTDEARCSDCCPAPRRLGPADHGADQQRVDLRVRQYRDRHARSWDRHLESNLRAPFVLTQAMAAQVPSPQPTRMASRRRRA